MYCLAVSAKRYALYNGLDDGTVRIRKFSAHGTGDLIDPPNYHSITPEPTENVYKLGGARWKYNCWYRAIQQVERGNTKVVIHSPELEAPVLAKLTLSTWHLYQSHSNIPDVRPFSFITVLPALSESVLIWRQNIERAARIGDNVFATSDSYEGLAGVTFYAPFGKSFADITGKVRRSDTHALITLEHKTLRERLAGYFRHSESKSIPSDGIGLLARRHVYI